MGAPSHGIAAARPCARAHRAQAMAHLARGSGGAAASQSFYPPLPGRGGLGRAAADHATGDSLSAPIAAEVWRAVCLVPRGRVTTYGELARALGGAWDSQAVGQALKRNPYAPAVPCHRVVRADCSLGGYFGGVAPEDPRMRKKVRLLESEGVRLLSENVAQGTAAPLRVHRDSVWRFDTGGADAVTAIASVRLPGEELAEKEVGEEEVGAEAPTEEVSA